ncbi:FdhD protein [Bacillus pakistanensis]|uniref:Sulfur carrier protein FdhD n=1 Tax=Rossellomorea pakistanensis TaxID=992288 RepID=A0ABS2N7P8_9BACI|nr:formate dehydrogenase accessory sulfurtransferase FdhD [Bacillus pakistanensis]MBM7583804.1 FdhD protein [Bacillus pakistanensis]
MKEFIQKRPIMRFQNGELVDAEDVIVSEFPLTIFVNNEEFATMVCSPDNLKELVYGFLASEGIIRMYNDILSFELDENKGMAYVQTSSPISIKQENYSKRFIGSCCGKSRQFYFQHDVKTAKTVMTETKISPHECLYLMEEMQKQSDVFQATGGVHNAALGTTSSIMIIRTDIGRHNALDKILGYCILNRISVRDKVLVFSGRISSEVLLKAAKIGVGVILSRSAPSELAIKLAEDLNITMVGFIRGGSFNVYTHSKRINN